MSLKRILPVILLSLTLLLASLSSSLSLKHKLKCLNLKQVKIDKVFRTELLSNRVYFPIGQNLEIGSEDAIDDPENFPLPKEGSGTKCFGITVKHRLETGHREIAKLPFNCIRDSNGQLFCHMNRKGTKDISHLVPFSLWGTAVVAKTDNRSFMLVVSCNSNKYASWILLHREETISYKLEKELLTFVQELGFDPGNSFSKNREQSTASLLYMDPEKKCAKNVWPPQID